MNDMTQVAAFLRRRISKLRRKMTRRQQREWFGWLCWHMSRYNSCAVEDSGKLVAVGVARAIHNPEDARFQYRNDETGKLLCVEHVAADTNDGFLELLRYVQKRWPQCKKIMFYRQKSMNKQKIYDMDNFMRKAFL